MMKKKKIMVDENEDDVEIGYSFWALNDVGQYWKWVRSCTAVYQNQSIKQPITNIILKKYITSPPQQYYNTSLKKRISRLASQFPAVLHYASLFSKFFQIQRNITNTTSTLDRWWCKDIPNSETNWIGRKGYDMEVTVKKQIRQMLQNK